MKQRKPHFKKNEEIKSLILGFQIFNDNFYPYHMIPTFSSNNSKRLCLYSSTIPPMNQFDVCTYCLHTKRQHAYYLDQTDNKHPCKVCDCLYFKSM